jgi:hypothetical protein
MIIFLLLLHALWLWRCFSFVFVDPQQHPPCQSLTALGQSMGDWELMCSLKSLIQAREKILDFLKEL